MSDLSKSTFKLQTNSDLESVNEEFNNFMHRVTQVSNIVHKLASSDSTQQNIGLAEADVLLNFPNCQKEEIIENNLSLTVTSNRTVLNKKALHEKERVKGKDGQQEIMDQEAFMNEMSRDANMRFKDKLIRTEKMETFKKQATNAFRRGEFEKALCLYTKAIEQIKDSPLLYNNRALTQIKLGRYLEAVGDLKFALRLNENCLKSFIFLARCYWFLGDLKQFDETVKETIEKNPSQVGYICETIEAFKAEKAASSSKAT